MKRFFTIATGSLALGLAALTPSLAKADGRHDTRRYDHRDVRVERHDDHREGRFERHDDHRGDRFERVRGHVELDRRPVYVDRRPVYVNRRPVIVDERPIYVNTDCDVSVDLGSLPGCVLDTVRYQALGEIESARLVRDDGFEFYRVLVDFRGSDHFVRVDLTGRLLGIDPC